MSENREYFRDTAERLFADIVTTAMIESAEEGVFPAILFEALEETGFTMMLVDEDRGGIGADLGDALAILRAAGRAAAPGPILETMLANSLLATAGEPVASGPKTIAFGELPRDVAWATVGPIVGVLDGSLALSTTSDWTRSEGRDASGEPRDDLSGPARSRRVPVDTSAALRQAALLRAGQMLGAMDWALERSVEYAGERKQFGREIGKFQAIQQMLAEMADHVLASAGITLAAGDATTATLIAAARSRLADAADAVVTISHQVHGAIGFSREYPLNHRTRRLIAWRDDYGTVATWRRSLAGDFMGSTLEEFWPALADAGATRMA